MAQSVDWVAGDQVAVSSGADYTIHTIGGGSTQSISISPGLTVGSGSLQSLDYGLSLDTRPEVALLTRSVTIRGAPQCRILASHLVVDNHDYQGSLTLSNVHVDGCGSDILNAIDVGSGVTPELEGCDKCPPDSIGPAATARISGSVVSASKRGGVAAVAAISLTIQDSAVVGTVGTAVDVRDPAQRPTVTGTLVMSARNYTVNPRTEKTACFSVCSTASAPCTAASMVRNVCAGSANAGFLVYAVACSQAMPYADNTAHDALVGVLIHGRGSSCAAAAGFAAYDCSEVAIPSLYGQVRGTCIDLVTECFC